MKPANLMFGKDGRLRIADFGIARIENADLTQAASLIGTPAYMAPERFQGLPMDRRVDLYATGVVLYQMLTGRVPFDPRGGTAAVMLAHLNQPPPRVTAVRRRSRSVLAPSQPHPQGFGEVLRIGGSKGRLRVQEESGGELDEL